MSKYQAELLALAARSNGTREDLVCEWSYNRHLYPTLIASVRRGIVGLEGVLLSAQALVAADRYAVLATAPGPVAPAFAGV
jgi:hypothetical protein